MYFWKTAPIKITGQIAIIVFKPANEIGAGQLIIGMCLRQNVIFQAYFGGHGNLVKPRMTKWRILIQPQLQNVTQAQIWVIVSWQLPVRAFNASG